VNSNASAQCPGDLKLVGFDVDGVFTDGRFYLSNDGVESKAFSTQDGFGVRQLLEAGIEVAVISGRQSVAVELRMAELGVKHLVQGCRDKIAAFDKIVLQLGIAIGQTAFVGDDVPDLPLLRHAGFAFAVANAVPAVKEECQLTITASGGAGAVREVCELVLEAKRRGQAL
jgi:3-deoxy-D-manno-octulosonate 8-phosphate phosphatase (KDO 8-P phosphatase)